MEKGITAFIGRHYKKWLSSSFFFFQHFTQERRSYVTLWFSRNGQSPKSPLPNESSYSPLRLGKVDRVQQDEAGTQNYVSRLPRQLKWPQSTWPASCSQHHWSWASCAKNGGNSLCHKWLHQVMRSWSKCSSSIMVAILGCSKGTSWRMRSRNFSCPNARRTPPFLVRSKK